MTSPLASLIKASELKILDAWTRDQNSASSLRRDLISEKELLEQSQQFLRSFLEALALDEQLDPKSPAWTEVKNYLGTLSRTRARMGFSPTETATFVFSLKNTLLHWLQDNVTPEDFLKDVLRLNLLLDHLGLITTEQHQKSREEIIRRQQADMLELSTPVVELAPSIIALPLIGTLDSQRAQTVMETLLEHIVASSADIAIIDITGVPTVDTLVAQHLMKTVAAARLMGAECIISGIRPQIAQTIVQLGLDLGHIHTKASLADAFKLALTQQGLYIASRKPAGAK